MRIAAFSDIHANLNGLNAVLADIERRGGADILVAAGDLVDGGPRPAETFDRLLEAGCLMLRGNHDEYMLGRGKEMIKAEIREKAWEQVQWAVAQFGAARLQILEQLPFHYTFKPGPDISGHNILVVHANLRNVYGFTGHLDQTEEVLVELYGDAPPGTEIIAFGHWHGSSVRFWRNMRLVNVASIAHANDKAKLSSYTFFTWNDTTQHWELEQHRVPYNWHEEVEFALQRGMPSRW